MSDEREEGGDPESAPGVAKAPPEEPGREHLKSILEALVFVAEKPATAAELSRGARSRVAEVRPLLAELIEEYRGRGVELVEVAGGYQFRTAAIAAPFVRDAVAQRPVRLSRAQVETLAITAYRQPVTRPEIDDIRGVDSGSALQVLLERGLLKILKKEVVGRPLLYGTTPQFLEFFGLGSLKDLPTLREFAELSDESKALFDKRGIGTLEVTKEEVHDETEADIAAANAEEAREVEAAERSSAGEAAAPEAESVAEAEADAVADADPDADTDADDDDADDDDEDDDDEDDEDDEDDDDDDE